MAASIHENEILKACRTLFGPDIWLDRHFLSYLQHDGAKAAYRKRAKETHPDRFSGESHIQKKQSEVFQSVNHAYDLVKNFLNHRDQGGWSAAPCQRAYRSAGAKPQAHAHRNQQQKWTGHGPLLSRSYEIGLYLYARGIIPYRTLIEALVWQRQQRPSIGETASRWGWLNEIAIRRIVNHRSPRGRRFGEKAIELDLLTPFQVRTLLFYQRSQHQRLGQYFVEKGYVTEAELEELVRELQEHNHRVARKAYQQAAT